MYSVEEELIESRNSIDRLLADSQRLDAIREIASLCVDALSRGNKILLVGNGGSAADAQHIAAEFVSRFNYDRPGLAAFALTTDTSALTAIGNDYGFDQVFARQVQAVGNSGDVLFGLSTSGTSSNILLAFKEASEKNIQTIGLCGEPGGKFDQYCDRVFRAPASSTPKIQEIHITVGHLICGLVEASIFPKSDKS